MLIDCENSSLRFSAYAFNSSSLFCLYDDIVWVSVGVHCSSECLWISVCIIEFHWNLVYPFLFFKLIDFPRATHFCSLFPPGLCLAYGLIGKVVLFVLYAKQIALCFCHSNHYLNCFALLWWRVASQWTTNSQWPALFSVLSSLWSLARQ